MLATSPLLIVDDEPVNLLALKETLGNEYPLMFAKNGADALALAVKRIPALVLLDIEMPDMNGYEVCQRLRSNPLTEHIPVIFISSKGTIDCKTLGLELGGIDYIIKPITPELVRLRVRNHLSMVRATQLERSYRDAIAMLGHAGHYNDNDTGVHIWRMAQYARVLAAAAGWSQVDYQLIELAAPMHDTGKIGIPDSILRKPGPLDAQEWVIMKTHSQIGHRILSQSKAPVFQLAAEIALCHHEKWDGSGYPAGLRGQDIPESARIVAVADVFDALTMKRPYKAAWEVDRAMATINEGIGLHFDPRLVALFNESLPAILEVKALWAEYEKKTQMSETYSLPEFVMGEVGAITYRASSCVNACAQIHKSGTCP